jgi:predicted enzyme related to lactoylglutathione lyase
MAKKARRTAKRSKKPARTKKRSKPKARRAAAPKRAAKAASTLGWVTHTELASANPAATQAFCAKVFGWTFRPPVDTPDGPYLLYNYSAIGGGGIRRNNPPEIPGSIPYIHVKDVRAAYELARSAGAAEMFPPTEVMPGIMAAIVKAPGDVPIGFSGP